MTQDDMFTLTKHEWGTVTRVLFDSDNKKECRPIALKIRRHFNRTPESDISVRVREISAAGWPIPSIFLGDDPSVDMLEPDRAAEVADEGFFDNAERISLGRFSAQSIVDFTRMYCNVRVIQAHLEEQYYAPLHHPALHTEHLFAVRVKGRYGLHMLLLWNKEAESLPHPKREPMKGVCLWHFGWVFMEGKEGRL